MSDGIDGLNTGATRAGEQPKQRSVDNPFGCVKFLQLIPFCQNIPGQPAETFIPQCYYDWYK